MMHVELQATCAALGYYEGDVYHKEPDCLETVKDLIRFLKHEDDTCEVRRQLGSAQIVQNDLVPLVKHYSDDSVLLDVVIRLLVNLTQPGVLCFQNQIPQDKTNRNYFLEIESHLQSYKEAFVDEGFFAIITKKLGDLLKLDWEHRQEEDRLLIERILVLIRNILHVPPNPAKEKRTDDDASIHDQVLWSLHISGMEDLLLYLASSEDETQFCLHVLEIISLMFREQTAEQLATSGVARSLSEKEQDERELEMMLERERAQKRASMLKYSGRHSCFGGTYTVSNMKSISDRDVIFHRRIGNIEDITFDHNKPKKKRPKNRAPITEVELTRRSTLSIRAFLREFCVQLLENCYNPLMYAVKDVLVRSKAQENDETYYLWATRFFMEFNRRYNFRIDLVSETMSVQSFHNIHMNLHTFHEMILTNKKEAVIWSRRLHLALNAYHELLQTLLAMEKTNDPQLRDSAKVMKSNVFYMLEYRDIFLMLLKDFDETRQSRTYLKDLVEATHLFVKMLESYSKTRSHLVVQKKKRHGGQRKKKEKASAHTNGAMETTEEELEEIWDNISSELSAIFQGRGEIPQEVTPFDAASEIDVDLQRVNAMRRIQEGLRANRPGEAVALFRAAREVWPEREEFGSADISPEDEFMALREICFANIPRPENEMPENNTPEPPEESDGEDELEESGVKVSEEEFNFNSFILRFVNPRVVQAYVTLLAQYKTNSAHTNHCLLKMLHRIGFECEMIGMLFQARLFRVFQSVYADPAHTTRHFKELVRFSQHVVGRFIEVAQKNSKVFMELFFWKSVRDVRDITEGYGYTEHQSKKVKQLWTEEEDMEVQRLVEQFTDEGVQDGDMADYVLANLIDQSKTRRQVVRQLVHLSLIGSAKELKRRNGLMRPREWQEEEVENLTQLLEEFKDNDYPLTDILANLKVKRSRPKVIEKLLELGLIQDKKEVMKKRKSKKGKKGKQGYEEEPEGMEEEHALTSDDEEHVDEEHETVVTSSDESVGDQSDADDDEPIYITKIRKAAKQAINSGLHVAVQWICDTLARTADEREEDGDEEPIPLVPITEETEEAMENSTFHTLLKRLGVKSPASEQEMFWRISGRLSPNDMRSRVEALKTCLAPDTCDSRKSKTGGHLEALRALARQKQADGGKRRRRHRGQTEDRGSEDQVMAEADQTEPVGASPNQSSPPGGRQAGRSRLKRSLPDFSEDESDNERLVIDTDAPAEAALQPAKRARVVDSDDSSDDDDNVGDTVKTQPQPVKRVKVVDSDDSSDDDDNVGDTVKTQPQPVKRVKVVDSDDSSDDDDNIGDTVKTQPQPVKRVKVVDSDDSSDDDDNVGDTVVTQPQAVKRVKVVDSDDSSDDDDNVGDTVKTQPQPVKRVKVVDTDDSGAESTHDNDTNDTVATAPHTELRSFPATLLAQTPDESDSDIDDHIPLRKVTKKCTIESDSDDD